jgi:two-component system NtrC family sensor kinase
MDAATLFHLQAHIDRVLSGHPVAFEHQEQSSEGNQQWSYINLLPDFDEVEQVRGFFVLGQNITELKRAEAQVREQYDRMMQSEKLATMGTLLASVAHELNNPLATLMLQVDALREDAETVALADQLDELKHTAERCMYTVQSFLALSRQTVSQRSPVSLNSVVEEALDLILHTLEMDDIRVQCDFSDALPSVEVNVHQFQQVILALLINAQQALYDISSAREIYLTTRFDAEQESVLLEIADTGPGVPEADQAKIFEPFYTTKPEGVGTGLGLSICQSIVLGHGGTLELVAPTTSGAVFRIELPIVTGHESTEAFNVADEETSCVPLSAKTILLVDDNEGNAKALARLLRRDGHSVDIRGDGHEALETLNQQLYDLIICDVHMPRLEGPELYERLSATHPHLLSRFLFITGDMLSPEIVDFFQHTDVPYLTKPFGAAKARRAVQQVLASQ